MVQSSQPEFVLHRSQRLSLRTLSGAPKSQTTEHTSSCIPRSNRLCDPVGNLQLARTHPSILLIFKWNTSGASACDQLILGWGAMSLKGFQKAAVRVRTESEYLRLMRSGSTVLIPPPLLGTPNLQAEIQYCAYLQINHTQYNVSFRLTVGQ